MEALTDNQRFGRFNIIPLLLFVAGHNDKGNRFWIPFFFRLWQGMNYVALEFIGLTTELSSLLPS